MIPFPQTVLFLLALYFLGSPLQAALRWRFSNPQPHGNNIIALARHNGIYWQVGDRGQVHTSRDLDFWIPRQTGVTNSLRAITVFQGNVYISGSSGIILSGSAPHALAARHLSTSAWLEGIAASADTIVAVGDAGVIFSSFDGTSWTPRGSFTQDLKNVIWAGDRFVVVGAAGFIATSTDGITWQERASGVDATLHRVEFIDGRYWIVGNSGTVLTTTTFRAFTVKNIPSAANLYTVTGSAAEVIVAGESVVYRSENGSGPWLSQSDSSTPTLAPLWPFYSSLWDGQFFLLGGRTGMFVQGFRTNQASPLLWYTPPQPTRRWLWGIAATPDLFVAVGDQGAIITSENAVAWNREVVPSDALDETLLGVGGTTNCLVAAGTSGTLLYSPAVFETTVRTNSRGQLVTNTVNLLGIYWNPVSKPANTNAFQGIAARDSTYVAVGGEGSILISNNGSNFVSRLSPVNTFLSSVTASPNLFAATGDRGTIITSSDGLLWFPRDSNVTNWIYAVRYLNGRFVAVGEEGLILTSDNGSNWQRRQSPTLQWLNDVAFANGRWFVAANSGLILSSPDAISWDIHPTITSKTLNGIVAAQGYLVSAGIEGVVIRHRLAPLRTPVNILDFNLAEQISFLLLTGDVDQRLGIDFKSSLSQPWSEVESLELLDPDGAAIVEIPTSGSPQGFFRTRLLD